MKNNLYKTFLLSLIVVLALLGLSFLPPIYLDGSTPLRKVNILADVERRETVGELVAEEGDELATEQQDSATVAVVKPKYEDKAPKGMVTIEDFADSMGMHREMDKFYRALASARDGNRPVRIAYLGDSYIEGDILTEDLREMFQSRYGGCGVGFVDIMSITSGFRQTVQHSVAGFSDHSVTDRGKHFDRQRQGINARYFVPEGQAWLELRGQRRIYRSHLDTCEVATIYFRPSAPMDVTASVNGGERHTLYQCTDSVCPDNTIFGKSVNGRIGRVRWNVEGGTDATFYGVALEGRHGVTVDNFSMRGSDGSHTASIPASTMRRFSSIRPYDLFILHYGLNVASPEAKGYSYYTKRFIKVIRFLQQTYPDASILVVSVGDRGQKDEEGEIHTMPGITSLVASQRRMAAEAGVAFWNMYGAMGGEGSVKRLRERNMVNLDYTHINARGGKHLAGLLFEVLMNGKENYDKRTNYE